MDLPEPTTPIQPTKPATPPGFSKSPVKSGPIESSRPRRSKAGVPPPKYADSGFLMESKKMDWTKVNAKSVEIPKRIEDIPNVPYSEFWEWALMQELTKIAGKETFRNLSPDELLKVKEKGVRITGNRIIFSVKFNSDGTIERFKA